MLKPSATGHFIIINSDVVERDLLTFPGITWIYHLGNFKVLKVMLPGSRKKTNCIVCSIITHSPCVLTTCDEPAQDDVLNSCVYIFLLAWNVPFVLLFALTVKLTSALPFQKIWMLPPDSYSWQLCAFTAPCSSSYSCSAHCYVLENGECFPST